MARGPHPSPSTELSVVSAGGRPSRGTCIRTASDRAYTRAMVAVLVVSALATIAASTAQTPMIETRPFTGVGSLGTDSPVEVYLLAGTYHHRLVGTTGCYTAASLFPSRDPLGVPLADVLQADLSVGQRSRGESETDPAGTVVISKAGWARLQVGTGPDCQWRYSITGRFLPRGDEPGPQSPASLWWLQVAGLAIVASLVILVLRRRSPGPVEKEEGPIRMVDPSGEA